MRYVLPAVMGVWCAVAFATPVYASGNVLLPPLPNGSNSNSNAMPNLGIAPPPPPVAAETPAAPALPAPAAAVTPPPVSTPVPTSTADDMSMDMSNMISPVNQATARTLPPGVMPTQVIHQPDMAQAMAESGRNLPASLTISMSNRSIFSAKDVQEISSKLGLTRDQIGTSCFLAPRGIMQTDKDVFNIDGGSSASTVTVRYAGMISGYMMSAQAFCLAGNNLPPGSGFLNQVGNRFIIPLDSIDCGPPNRQVSQLVITYDGSGKSQCVYQ